MGKSLSNTVFIVDVGFRAEHKNVRFPSSVLNQGLIWLLSWKSFIMMIYSKINRQCRAQKSSRESFRNPPRTLSRNDTFLVENEDFSFWWQAREREREKKKASLFAVTSSFRERKKTPKKTHTPDDFVICEKHLSVTGAALFLIPRSRGHKLLLAVRSKKKKKKRERERERSGF